jgi:hypothetical protein
VTTTAAPADGLTLTELAVLRRIPRERAAALIEPFVPAGLVAVRDDPLMVTDRLVASAFSEWEGDL